ncbi:MAG: phosphoenolpyruvate--protein phosphotransferase [Gammaproteobacteria bacterium]|nr:phosphoenolpyruvate--protein phosphotransferase [Gammaproteobacteria bacterium]
MLDALPELIRLIRSEPDFLKVAHIVVTRVPDILGCEVGSLFVRDQSTNTMHMIANDGYELPPDQEIIVPAGKGIVGLVAHRYEPLNVPDILANPHFYDHPDTADERYRAFLGVPVMHRRSVVGVLTAQRFEDPFSEDEEGFLTSVAATLSSGLSKALDNREIRLSAESAAIVRPERVIRGVAGSPGIAIGHTVLMQPSANLEAVRDRLVDVDALGAELQKLDIALASVRAEIQGINLSMSDHVGEEELALFDAYLRILDDDAIAGEVRTEIRESKHWAQSAVANVFTKHVRALESSKSSLMSERAKDVRDLGERLLHSLQVIGHRSTGALPKDAIVVAQDITPAMIAEHNLEHLKGLVAISGSINSHSAILARALNKPAVMGVTNLDLSDLEDAQIIVDGYYGEVVLHPTSETIDRYLELVQHDQEFAIELEQIRDQPSETKDGRRVNLWVNIGMVSEISRSLDRGAEGIGLFRTEIPFASRDRFPTEEEQRQIYREHMQAFEPRPVTMRTLDIGGDKPLPYFPIDEENPYLGWRGIRVSLDHPDIFLVQIRAMLKANAELDGILRIMLPMITTIDEIKSAKRLIKQAFDEVIAEGFNVKFPLIGAMIEVPALLWQLDSVCEEVDFLAVGSNDLTQYMLAVSRNNPKVATLYQEFHPAILQTLDHLASVAHEKGHGIGICGEMAGTVEGAVVCIGFGYDVLSMNATNLPRVKWVIQRITTFSASRIAKRAKQLDDAESVLTYIRNQLSALNLEKAIPHHEHPEIFF